MPKSVLVKGGQCLLDIAIEHTGGIASWLEIATLNSLGLSSDIVPGTYLLVPDEIVDKKAYRLLTEAKAQPATGDVGFLSLPEGIDYWYVEQDFKIS
jgi:hypothetical protein